MQGEENLLKLQEKQPLEKNKKLFNSLCYWLYYSLKYLVFLYILGWIVFFDSFLLFGWWGFQGSSESEPNWFFVLNLFIMMGEVLLVFILNTYIVVAILKFRKLAHIIRITLFFILSTTSVHIGFFFAILSIGKGNKRKA